MLSIHSQRNVFLFFLHLVESRDSSFFRVTMFPVTIFKLGYVRLCGFSRGKTCLHFRHLVKTEWKRRISKVEISRCIDLLFFLFFFTKLQQSKFPSFYWSASTRFRLAPLTFTILTRRHLLHYYRVSYIISRVCVESFVDARGGTRKRNLYFPFELFQRRTLELHAPVPPDARQ